MFQHPLFASDKYKKVFYKRIFRDKKKIDLRASMKIINVDIARAIDLLQVG